MFNPRRAYGEVSGTGVAGARYMQDGQYYDVDGRYLFSNPGIQAPAGLKRRSMEEAEAEFQRRLAARSRGEIIDDEPELAEASKPKAPPSKTPPLPQQPPEGEPLTKEQQLMQLNVPRLQELQIEAMVALQSDKPEAERKSVKDLKADMIKGPGAKERLVKWLVENTAE